MPQPDLFAAIIEWFKGDAALTEAFPGGIVAGRGGVAQGFPYVKVAWRKPQPGLTMEDEQYLVTLSAYALTDDAAADLGETLVKAFTDEARPPVTFTDKRGQAWRESCRIEQEAQGPDLVDYLAAVDGAPEGNVWRYSVPIELWVALLP